MERELHEFYLMEYSALRSQLFQQYQTTFNWFKYTIAANAAIVVWTFSTYSGQSNLVELRYAAAALPLAISIFGHLLFFISYRSISAIIEYLKKIDRIYGEDVGFAKFYDKRTAHAKLPSKRSSLNTMYFSMDILSLIFLAIAILTS